MDRAIDIAFEIGFYALLALIPIAVAVLVIGSVAAPILDLYAALGWEGLLIPLGCAGLITLLGGYAS